MARRLRFDVSRRRLLQSLGLGAAAGPLIPLLNASAQTAPRPKRLLLLFTPDGLGGQDTTHVDWKPTGTETAFKFSSIHTPLDPFKAKIVVPWGLTLTVGRRGRAARVRDGGPVVRHDAARAEQRRELRRRQRPPDRLGRRADDRSHRRAGLRRGHAVPALADGREPGDALPEHRARRAMWQPELGDPDVLHGRQRAGQPRGQPEGGVRSLLHGRDGQRDGAADGGSGGDARAQRAEGRRRSAEGRPVAHPEADRRRRLPEDRRAPGRRARDGAAHRAAADHADPDGRLHGPAVADDGHQQQRELPDAGHADDGHRGAHPGVRRDARADAAAQPRIQRHRAHLAGAHERPPHDVSRRHGSAHRADRRSTTGTRSRSRTCSESWTR